MKINRYSQKSYELIINEIRTIPPSGLGFKCNSDMPPHINILFRARPPLPFAQQMSKRYSWRYDGVLGQSQDILERFEKSTPSKIEKKVGSKEERKLIAIAGKIETQKEKNQVKEKEWCPKKNINATSDPFKTLFVYGLNHKTKEKTILREFERYGHVQNAKLIKDLEGKSKGYAFVEFKHIADMHYAHKKADRIMLDEKRIHVDYEKGRTDAKFKPRRLGGGLGNARAFPKWMEKELKEIQKIILKKKKDEGVDTGKKRERSRDKEIEIPQEIEVGEIQID